MTAPGIDARGVHASTDILERIIEGLDEVPVGEAISVLTDDFEAIDTDVRSWAQVTGHEVKAVAEEDSVLYTIVKAEPRPTAERLVVVVSGDRSEELETPIGVARAALLEGLEVSVFFRHSSVRVLSRFFMPRRRLRDRMARRRSPHPHGEVFRLFDHGARIYACGLSMEEHGITPDDLLFDNIKVAEYATLVAIMKEADIQLVA